MLGVGAGGPFARWRRTLRTAAAARLADSPALTTLAG